MDEANNGNGNGVKSTAVPHVTITFDPVAFKVQVGGSIHDSDMILCVLDQAKRVIEFEVRKIQAIAMQNAVIAAMREREIVDSLRKQ